MYEIEDFEVQVIQQSYTVPVLVDFWASWCGPCKVLGPILERLAEENSDRWILAKLDTDQNPTISTRFGIRNIPNVKLFVDGEVSDEFVGALPEPRIIEWLGKAVPSKSRLQIAEVRKMLLEGRDSTALEELQKVLAIEPKNEEANVLRAQALLSSDTSAALNAVEWITLGSKQSDAAEAIRVLARLIKRAENPQLLPAESVRSEYLKAVSYVCSGDFQSALEKFIKVIRSNRDYDGDGARLACIAIFELLGTDCDTTRRYRPQFSQALF